MSFYNLCHQCHQLLLLHLTVNTPECVRGSSFFYVCNYLLIAFLTRPQKIGEPGNDPFEVYFWAHQHLTTHKLASESKPNADGALHVVTAVINRTGSDPNRFHVAVKTLNCQIFNCFCSRLINRQPSRPTDILHTASCQTKPNESDESGVFLIILFHIVFICFAVFRTANCKPNPNQSHSLTGRSLGLNRV